MEEQENLYSEGDFQRVLHRICDLGIELADVLEHYGNMHGRTSDEILERVAETDDFAVAMRAMEELTELIDTK